jgi:hypothetical protein
MSSYNSSVIAKVNAPAAMITIPDQLNVLAEPGNDSISEKAGGSGSMVDGAAVSVSVGEGVRETVKAVEELVSVVSPAKSGVEPVAASCTLSLNLSNAAVASSSSLALTVAVLDASTVLLVKPTVLVRTSTSTYTHHSTYQ